ncbi:receptor-type tyrosine-protein phosphatase H [Neolamprologus brichardi]|uniref:receptor-type tyrosine-protein phosphatase H n=1 Tax=Neolamprologus brichardi TaxID=32507 RepID=UPI001643AC9B|nr:receptor-type tyrosine-protein phosphatase H [Neolamprologus brichardi]
MKLLSLISDHLLLCVSLSLLWGTTDSTTTAKTETTTRLTTNLLTTTTRKSTSLAQKKESSTPDNVDRVDVTTQNENSITLTWNKVNNIPTYILQYDNIPEDINKAEEGPIVHVVTSLTAGTNYTFTLFTTSDGLNSSGHTFSAVTAPRNAEEFKSIGQNETSIKLQWKTVPNSDSFILLFNEGEINIKNSIKEYTVSDLTDGTRYTFTLFTVFGNVRSSGVNCIAVTAPQSVNNVTVVHQNEMSIPLEWDKVKNIPEYILQNNNINISPRNADKFKKNGQNETSITLGWKTVPNIDNYILAFNEREINISNSEKEYRVITLTWNKVNNTSTYILQYDNITEKINKTEEGPIVHVVTSLTAGTNYTFTLLTTSDGVNSSGYTFSAVTAPRNAEEFKAIGQNETSIKLQWKTVSNSNNYLLVFNEKKINIKNSTEEYTVSNLTDGTRYTFTLFTVFGNVRSSGVNCTAVTAPQRVNNVNVVHQNETSITLEWEKVKNIPEYILQYNNSTDMEKNISASQEGPIKYEVSPLTAMTKYNFTLITVFEGVSSTGYSFTAVTAPENVHNMTVTQNESSITLMWEKVNDMLTYILEYDSDNIVIGKNDMGGCTTSGASVTCVVSSLTAGTNYSFTLFTVFENVNSSGYNFSAPTVPKVVPWVSVTERFVNSIALEWENMNKAWQYKLQINGDVSDSVSDVSSDTIRKVVTSLQPGTQYDFSLTTVFAGLRSTPYTNFTVTAIDCASADWKVTNSSIKAKIEGLFSNASAYNGSNVHVSDGQENVSFTGLYPGATYNISLVYEKSSRVFLQCEHKLTILPPNLNAHCEYWAAGYSVLIKWTAPEGEWTNAEVNVAGTTHTVVSPETEIIIDGFQPAKKYNVSVTSLSGVRSSEPHVFYCQTDPRGVIAGSVFGVLLFCLLVALVVFIFLKRPDIISRKKSSFISGSKVSNTQSKSIPAAKFPDHFHQLSLDENRGFSEEYECLAPVGTDQTRKTAILPENKTKNRFNNVLPYDWCRVKLTTSDPDGISDYINANYMPGYSSNREYIATQGPLPSTVNDFWRMIWEQRVKRIVMVTNCIEGGRTKCEQYWPTDSKSCLYGELLVTMRSEQQETNWTLREFNLKDRKTAEERTVKHFHFTAWPDHGVPECTEVLIQFRGLVRQHIEREGGKAPTVVHCSAGVGRTGTIISLDVLLQQLEKEQAVGINAFVHKMRLNRPYMVQTESQYVFLHQCIMDSLQPKDTNEENIYENTYENADMIYVNATALQELRRQNANA